MQQFTACCMKSFIAFRTSMAVTKLVSSQQGIRVWHTSSRGCPEGYRFGADIWHLLYCTNFVYGSGHARSYCGLATENTTIRTMRMPTCQLVAWDI